MQTASRNTVGWVEPSETRHPAHETKAGGLTCL